MEFTQYSCYYCAVIIIVSIIIIKMMQMVIRMKTHHLLKSHLNSIIPFTHSVKIGSFFILFCPEPPRQYDPTYSVPQIPQVSKEIWV